MTTATDSPITIDSPIFAEDPSTFDITSMEVEQSPSAERQLTPPNTVRVVVTYASGDQVGSFWKLLRDIPVSEQQRIRYSLPFEAPNDEIIRPGDAAATESLTTPMGTPCEAPPSVRRFVVEVEAEPGWTDAKNERRCHLIDKDIAGTLSAMERAEVEGLQREMLAYRRQVAPLPLDELRRDHQDLLRRRRNAD